MRSVLVLLLLVLAGCSEPPAAPDAADDDFDDVDVEVTEETGAIRGVVVDQAIVPIQGALIAFTENGAPREATTDAEGRFTFSKVTPGTYFLSASSSLHVSADTAVTVVAGVKDPAVVKIQLERRFAEAPYIQPFHFQGRLACHVQAGATAPCITDWTQVVPGCGSGCVPQLRTLMGDARDFLYAIGPGWQTHIVEEVWEPSSSATSQNLGIILRDFVPGGANHQYASVGGSSPTWLRLDLDRQPHATQSGSNSLEIPPEGYDQILHFTGVRTEPGQFAAVAIEQSFEVFVNTFYFGVPPEEWSFVRGDGSPW